MLNISNKPSRFWQELKRRRVVHVITVYASASYVIIELLNNLAEPLNLPPRLLTIVIIVLAVGFPLVIVLSWLYELTSGSLERTRPIDEMPEGEKAKLPNAWKLATIVSFVVIIGLVVFNLASWERLVKPGSIPSLVVLPFGNFTGDEVPEYFVSGIHSSLIGDMGRIGGLRIISQTSSKVNKNRNLSIPQIASELDVSIVVEPTVICLGDTICIQVKLFSALPKETLIWVADYKVEKSQIQNLYSRITKQIADEVKIELTPGEERMLAESRTVNPDAYDAYLKGQFHWERLGKDDLDSALHYFKLAIELDPDWADPYADIALTLGTLRGFQYITGDEIYNDALNYLKKALELDPNTSNSHYVNAMFSVWTLGDWEKGEKEFQKTLELNPNDALCRIYYAHLLLILHRFDEAIQQANLALKLDPLKPLLLGLYGVVMNFTGNHNAALTQTKKALALDPENNFAFNMLKESYLATGDTLKWYELWKTGLWWTTETYLDSLDKIFKEQGYLAVINDRIRLNEEWYASGKTISFSGQAGRYLIIGDYDRAIDYFEKDYEVNQGMLSYISLETQKFPELKNNKRYIALLKKMNLPLPEAD